MYEPKPCEKCNAICKFFMNCPRLGMGWYLCPNCNEDEYLHYFPPMEYKIIHNRLKYKLEKAKNVLREFEEAYSENPKETLQKHDSNFTIE